MQQVCSTRLGSLAIAMRGVVLVLLSLAAPTTTHAQPLTTAKLGEVHQSAPVDTTQTAPLPNAETIIRNFIAAETQFREALLQFSFKRDVVLQTIGPRGEITGEYIRQSGFVLDDLGQRIERVVYHPASTIKLLKITKEDVQDLSGSQLFGLEPAEMAAYNFSYLGDELFKQSTVHLIAVSPKQEPNPQRMRSRFFVGRIWIDAASFQIVKLQGTTEPHGKQRFPAFETERGLEIEDRLFPSTTSADDVLRFPKLDVHYRIAVRYYDFKRFAGRLKIVEISGSE